MEKETDIVKRTDRDRKNEHRQKEITQTEKGSTQKEWKTGHGRKENGKTYRHKQKERQTQK